jgi:hypothetical protein
MIRFGGVSVWRNEWGDPTRLFVAAVVAACLAGVFFKIAGSERLGWPGDALFVERLNDPLKFYIILGVVGLLALAALAILLSTAWDLVAAWRRGSGAQ